MIISTIFRNRTTQKILRVVVPLAFWLGAWQLAAIWVDTVYTPGHGALLLPSPLLVWERLACFFRIFNSQHQVITTDRVVMFPRISCTIRGNGIYRFIPATIIKSTINLTL